MRKLRFLLAAATLCAIAAPALGADLDAPILVEAPDEYVPVEVGSGWYLRGDLTYAAGSDMDGVSYRTFDNDTDSYSNNSFATSGLDAGFGGGVGFGYRFSDYFRTDFTADITKSDFEGATRSDLTCGGVDAAQTTTCRSEDKTSLYTQSYLVNGYVDLGTFSGFTPYAGAGIGVSRVKWDSLESRLYCVDGTDECARVSDSEVSRSGRKDWRLTYALMAGVAYDLTETVKLDLGYRFKHVDGGDMFRWDSATAASGATGVQGTDDGYNFHEVKVGFRYELW